MAKKISKTAKECFAFEIQYAVMLLVQSVSVICSYIWVLFRNSEMLIIVKCS